MALPSPYVAADDATIVDGCLAGEPEAWTALEKRHGALVAATVVRALDRSRTDADVDAYARLVWTELRKNGGAALAQWSGECQLRSYLALYARHVTLAHGESASPASFLASLPTPSGLFLDDLLAIEPAARIEEALVKLPPNIAALIRLRLRGLSHADIAATLGMSPAIVRTNLERVARRLGELDAGPFDASQLEHAQRSGLRASTGATWRVLLDAADIDERVGLAIRTEEDPDFRSVRSLVEKTWRAVGERALSRPAPRTIHCLDDRAMAGFVDGRLRGAARARAEGHVASCPRCIDEAAALVIDLRVMTTLRDAAELDPLLAVAAACLATTRFAAAEDLAKRVLDRGVNRVARDVHRLAQAGRLLEGGHRGETSKVVATHMPDDDEAPLIAFEALVHSDPHTAWSAIDDHLAKQTLGARLRLLAAASGQDLDAARSLAMTPTVDPGHAYDCRAVSALPRGRTLPREILVERLRALVPEAVRFVLTRPS